MYEILATVKGLIALNLLINGPASTGIQSWDVAVRLFSRFVTMRKVNTRKIALVGISIFAVSVSGCLSKEESDTSGFTGGNTQSQNSSPVISGSPQGAVMMGDDYSFTPTASDPDGDSLTFSVRGLPTWADFSPSTGTVSGQPTLADVGVYVSISISVSDGQASASLPTFDITVSQAALGAMTLTWTAPVENTDGSALTDLAGYNVYFGDSSGSYTSHVRVDNPSVSTYVIENLVPKTYFVVATAFNSAGVESAYSDEIAKTVLAQ